MSKPDTYHCPVCGRSFDMTDRLADFALAAHEKEHRTMEPVNLLAEKDGQWACKQCGHPCGTSKDMAVFAMITHMKAHGIRPVSTIAPDKTRGSGPTGGAPASRRSVGDVLEDVVDAIAGFFSD